MIGRARFFSGYRSTWGSLHQLQVDGLMFLLDSFEDHPLWTDVRHMAYALATCKLECGDSWQPIEERGSRVYLSKYYFRPSLRRALGNIRLSDSWEFKGRGYVQITGRANYKKFGIEDTPAKALEPEIAFRIMTDGMHKGLFTGRKLSDYIGGVRVTDYFNARKIINSLDRAGEIAANANKFERILKASST